MPCAAILFAVNYLNANWWIAFMLICCDQSSKTIYLYVLHMIRIYDRPLQEAEYSG